MHGTQKGGGAPFTDRDPESKGFTHQEKWKVAGVPDRHTRRSGTVEVVCGPFTRLQHGVGGVEWGGDVFRSEHVPPTAHRTEIERGRKREGGGGGNKQWGQKTASQGQNILQNPVLRRAGTQKIVPFLHFFRDTLCREIIIFANN